MIVGYEARPSVFIVDDEPAVRRILRHGAEAAGYDVAEAEDGQALLELLERRIPAVIVLDLQMASTDGVQTIRQLAARGVGSEIILCSGMDRRTLESTRDIAQRQGLNITALLQKPVRLSELIELLKSSALERAAFSSEILRRCLDQKRLTVNYQPKLDLSSLQIVGVEALLRCQDDIGRAVPPDVVVETAEACGLIDEVTESVFRQSLKQQSAWAKSGIDLGLAINMSPRCSFGEQLPDLLSSFCREAEVPESGVTIELTETTVMDDDIIGMEALVRLRLKGFRLSIDDFGTGYSSLTRLKKLPFSEIKVDRSFVGNLVESRENIAIVSSILYLARSMDLHSVIEGIEDQSAFNFAVERGCDAAQGYLIARPMRGEEVSGFLQSWHWRQEGFRQNLRSTSPKPESREQPKSG